MDQPTKHLHDLAPMKATAARRDGFSGQHMVVVPEPMRAQARRHALLRGLHVTDAGYFPSARGHGVERAEGAPTILLILCLRGRGWVREGDERREVIAGDVAWLAARRAHAYGADADDPWTIAWAHFAGEEVAAWRELLAGAAAGAGGRWHVSSDRLDEVALERVHVALERGFALRHQIAAATALRHALSAIVELMAERHDPRSAAERVAAAAAALQHDWARPHRLEELATAAGMSVTHFSAHFRRLTGLAPIDYLIRLRIRQACRLLDTTALGVGEVAVRAGYEDAYYFARCFRRVMGCSPTEYRRVQKG